MEHAEVEKGHGRIESRRVTTFDITTWGAHPWPGLRSIARVEATRDIGGNRSPERRYYITTLPSDPQRIGQAIRHHWSVENRMHWVLDMAFDEDRSRVRVRNAAQNLAIVRRIAMNLLRQDTTSRTGLRTRRFRAGADDVYRARLLGLKNRR
jgi:predicted transposase YbfD/YdcC